MINDGSTVDIMVHETVVYGYVENFRDDINFNNNEN